MSCPGLRRKLNPSTFFEAGCKPTDKKGHRVSCETLKLPNPKSPVQCDRCRPVTSVVTVLLVPCSPCDRPRVIESLRGVEVVDIAAGGAHSACITASGELFTWGKGRYGRLGHGDSEDQLKPKLVSDPQPQL